MIHCSSCGGKLAAGAARCGYCGGTVSARDRGLGPACPECFARLAPDAGFCSDCGVRIEPAALGAVSASATCPRCRGALVVREGPAGGFTECPGCGGIWLDSRVFARILETRDAAPVVGAFEGDRPSQRTSAAGEVRYVPCPVCGRLMNRKQFAERSGVIIDWCRGHGFWFDADELEKVVEFVRSGGLDEARQRAIEKAKDMVRMEERKAAAGTAPRALPLGAGGEDGPRPGGAISDIVDTLVDVLLGWR
jgi:Zn-finger nucleic acid-binding protein